MRRALAGFLVFSLIAGATTFLPGSRADSWACGAVRYASDPLSELVTNGGFEADLANWFTASPTVLPTASTAFYHSGAKAAHVLDEGNPGNENAAQNLSSPPPAFVLSYWFYVAAWGTGGHFGVDLLRNWDYSTADLISAAYWLAPNTLYWDVWVPRGGGGGVRNSYPMTLTTGTWHRFDTVVDSDRGIQCLFIDGTFLDSSAVSPANAFLPRHVVFGDLSWSGDPGDGSYDDVSILALDEVPPDYVPANPQPSGAIRMEGSRPLTLAITVENPWEATANAPSTLAFFNESTPADPFATFTVPALGPRGSAGPFTATWRSPATPGTYRIVAMVDHGNDVAEGNETNNTYTWTVTVVPAPTLNWKPVVAFLFAVVLALVGVVLAWRMRRTKGPQSEWKPVLLVALGFATAEAGTGIASAFFGVLAIPPVVGLGTIVDCALLATGLIATALLFQRATLTSPQVLAPPRGG